MKRTASHVRTRAFIAWLNEIPVGAAGIEITDDIACLFAAGVLPEYRRRGIQSVLILRRLQQAQNETCPLAVIHCNPGVATERNAVRLGFQLAYTKVIMRMRGPGLMPSP